MSYCALSREGTQGKEGAGGWKISLSSCEKECTTAFVWTWCHDGHLLGACSSESVVQTDVVCIVTFN